MVFEPATDFGSISEEERAFLEQRGYTLLRTLGSGKTRTAYLAHHQRGDVLRVVVIKDPRTGKPAAFMTNRLVFILE